MQAKLVAEQVAPTDATVLLEGPTGSGKELFAQAIHQASPRHSRPFVAVNCSAFSKELLESELFGYRKGTFTGAQGDKKGLIEEANSGTLFLDEIGELELGLQAKLLRVLEDQEFIKTGDTKPTRMNVRLVAATNRNLCQKAEQGRFRPDLYYRLSVVVVAVSALSARRADIPMLVESFLLQFSAKLRKHTLAVWSRRMVAYIWEPPSKQIDGKSTTRLRHDNAGNPAPYPAKYRKPANASQTLWHRPENGGQMAQSHEHRRGCAGP